MRPGWSRGTVVGSVRTPELDRLRTVRDRSQTIGEFLEWLRSEKQVTMTRWTKGLTDTRVCRGVQGDTDRDNCDAGVVRHNITQIVGGAVTFRAHKDALCPVCRGSGREEYEVEAQDVPWAPPIEVLLAEFFEIDLDKVERERRALLEELGRQGARERGSDA